MRVLCLSLMLLVLGGGVFAQESIYGLSTQELARRVADHVAANGDRMVVVVAKEVFELSRIEDSNMPPSATSLNISRYSTTLNLDQLPSPAHVIAEQFIWGQPKIHMEGHFTDYGISGTAFVFQLFTKYRNGGYEGFTREERDHGKKSGVEEEIYHGGKIRRSRGLLFWRSGWRKATDEERQVVQEAYRSELLTLVAHLKLR